ncbi:MAG: bleomycin resistance protein [Frankiales bacterium]|nr:bleomycin resistance protein [Frankiales bacterium]
MLGQFWAELLGREAVGGLVPGTATQIGLRFVGSSAPANQLHLHVTSSELAEQQQHVDRAISLGATPLDIGQTPEEGHIVLADPEGNPFCVIEPGNRFLAGCGLLGELACSGAREVGVFWSEALTWPLVWDQNEETAVQSPHGGTKLAWGGQPDPAWANDQPRFELIGDPSVEISRLTALGATDLGGGVLVDPGGMPFSVA